MAGPLPAACGRMEQTVRHELTGLAGGAPTLDQKVEFLGRPEAYSTVAHDVTRRETHMSWVFLAGDWVQTGLPATIEGALRSGETAAALALKHLSL